MTDEINVLSRTQIINVEPSSGSVSVINAGPQGPGGPSGSSSGTVILVGTGPPQPTDGATGNYWLDKTNDILYGPKGTVAPVWDVALYGAETPPALLGETRRTTSPAFSTTMLSVNIDLPVATRLHVFLNIYMVLQAGAVYAFDCRIDGSIVGRFDWLKRDGINYVSSSAIIASVPAGQHTVSLYPNRQAGSGNCSFEASTIMPAYLSVYKDRK